MIYIHKLDNDKYNKKIMLPYAPYAIIFSW